LEWNVRLLRDEEEVKSFKTQDESWRVVSEVIVGEDV
jgi:hypothetical protein